MDKLNIYALYNFDYEDTFFVKLYHPTLFKKEEFEKIVNECKDKVNSIKDETLKLIEKIEKNELEVSEEDLERIYSFTESGIIYQEIKKLMIEEYGFMDLEPVYTYAFYDGAYWSGKKLTNAVLNK